MVAGLSHHGVVSSVFFLHTVPTSVCPASVFLMFLLANSLLSFTFSFSYTSFSIVETSVLTLVSNNNYTAALFLEDLAFSWEEPGFPFPPGRSQDSGFLPGGKEISLPPGRILDPPKSHFLLRHIHIGTFSGCMYRAFFLDYRVENLNKSVQNRPGEAKIGTYNNKAWSNLFAKFQRFSRSGCQIGAE